MAVRTASGGEWSGGSAAEQPLQMMTERQVPSRYSLSSSQNLERVKEFNRHSKIFGHERFCKIYFSFINEFLTKSLHNFMHADLE